jgi:hypothetical protein
MKSTQDWYCRVVGLSAAVAVVLCFAEYTAGALSCVLTDWILGNAPAQMGSLGYVMVSRHVRRVCAASGANPC